MNRKTISRLLALLAVFALIAAACGDSSETTTGDTAAATTAAAAETTAAPAETTAAPAETTAAPEEAMALPGEGVDVTMARANWSTGYFQAEIYRLLLGELGYNVSPPSELELGPNQFYTALAEGDADLWANSWYPGHISWHQNELTDGSLVADHVSIVGEEMIAGGLQGFLITKATADEYGITHLDQLNDDPEITALFDTDGDGVAEIFGCQESWTCDNIITAQIAYSGWDNITQTIAGYDAMIAQMIDRVAQDEPGVIYTWTPSAYITELRPGDNVVWLAMEDILDDSNPTDFEGGEAFDQRPGTANLSPETCPAAADAGICQVGWSVADIQVTINNDFGDANPAALALLDAVKLSVIDVSLANVRQSNGEDTTEAIVAMAQEWIDNNRDLVDGWIAAAMAAA